MIRTSNPTSTRTRALAGLGAVAMLMGAGLVPSAQTPARGTEQVTSEAVLVSGNAFFRHDFAEVGARPNGSFGSAVAAPSGWHPVKGNGRIGFVADRDKDGWGVGIDDGDFFLPGAEYEGWGLEVVRGASVSTAYNHEFRSNLNWNGIPGAFLAVEDPAVARVRWASDEPFAGVTVSKAYSLPADGGQTLQMQVELTNTGTDPAVIVYKRGVDPDNCQDRANPGGPPGVELCTFPLIEPRPTDTWDAYEDSWATFNRVESQRARGDVLSAVSASQTDGSYLGLWSADPDSVVFAGASEPGGPWPSYGFFCRQPNDLLGLFEAMRSNTDFTNAAPFDHAGAASGNCGQYLNAPGPEVLIDDMIYLMIRKEIPAGATVSFELAYSLSSQDFAAEVLAVLEANMTVSDAPTEVSGVAGDGQVTVSWTAPEEDGGSPITGYKVTASPGGASCTVDAPATSCVVSGLTNGTAYTFTVVATNGVGDSQPSAASAAVTPVAPPATTPPTTTPPPVTESTPVRAEAVLVGGVAPSVPAGAGVWVRADGTEVALTVSAPEAGQVRFEADGLRVTFTGAEGTSASAGLVADENGEVECEICVELAAGNIASVWMFSTPRFLGEHVIADLPCQRFTVSLKDPADGEGPAVAGAHTLQLAFPVDGGTEAVNVGLTVGGPVPTEVPSGEGSVPAPFGAVLFVLLGAVGVLVASRRLVTAG